MPSLRRGIKEQKEREHMFKWDVYIGNVRICYEERITVLHCRTTPLYNVFKLTTPLLQVPCLNVTCNQPAKTWSCYMPHFWICVVVIKIRQSEVSAGMKSLVCVRMWVSWRWRQLSGNRCHLQSLCCCCRLWQFFKRLGSVKVSDQHTSLPLSPHSHWMHTHSYRTASLWSLIGQQHLNANGFVK